MAGPGTGSLENSLFKLLLEAIILAQWSTDNQNKDSPHRLKLQICKALQLFPAPRDLLPAGRASESAEEVGQRLGLNPTLLRLVVGPSDPCGEDSTEACTWHPSHHTALLVAAAVAAGFERPGQQRRQCQQHLPW